MWLVCKQLKDTFRVSMAQKQKQQCVLHKTILWECPVDKKPKFLNSNSTYAWRNEK